MENVDKQQIYAMAVQDYQAIGRTIELLIQTHKNIHKWLTENPIEKEEGVQKDAVKEDVPVASTPIQSPAVESAYNV